MKITAIKQQVKRNDRYSIYVDESYSFSLSEAALLKAGIASGQDVSIDDVAVYKKLSTDDKLFNRALAYVAARPHSAWELQIYLQRKDASEQFITQTINRLTELGLLNDTSFAESFVRDRQTLKPTSIRKLRLELRQKHIAESDITKALDSTDFDEDVSLQQLIAKKRRQTKYQDDQKLMQYLARQGYNFNAIKSALNQDEDY